MGKVELEIRVIFLFFLDVSARYHKCYYLCVCVCVCVRVRVHCHRSEVLYRWRSQGKRKGRKTVKDRSEEKVVDFSSASLSAARKFKTVTQGGTI